MAALLLGGELVLEVHTSCTVLSKQLGQLDNCRETSVTIYESVQYARVVANYHLPSVAVCNDRTHVVQVWCLRPFLWAHLPPIVPVLAIMELLSLEEPLHLVWDGVVWVIAKVGGDFVGGGQDRRARPPGDVKHLLIRSLLGHLHRVNGTHYSTDTSAVGLSKVYEY